MAIGISYRDTLVCCRLQHCGAQPFTTLILRALNDLTNITTSTVLSSLQTQSSFSTGLDQHQCSGRPCCTVNQYACIMIDPSLRLRRAIYNDDALLVQRILRSNPHLLHNPDYSPSGLSNTSLHLACSLGFVRIVSLLLSLGHEKDMISLNEEHQTPLMLAAREGHTETVHLLCREGAAGVARRDVRGRDAVMEASRGGHDTCLQILLTYAPVQEDGVSGAKTLLENADIDGNTALHFASSNGHLLVLRTLLAAGADPERRNVWSWTAVAYSATVQAEVYFKSLVAETEKRDRIKREAAAGDQRSGGGIRLVTNEA